MRVPAPDLHAQAVEEIGGWVADYRRGRADYAAQAEDCGWPEVPVVPGAKLFYGAADQVIGPRQRTAEARYYVAPGDALVEEVARVMLDEGRPALGAHLTSKHAGTDVERKAA